MKQITAIIEWIKSYLLQNAIAEDQSWNARTGGMADETLSARAHRLHMRRQRSWPRNMINMIFFWQPDHCREAYVSELERKQLPAEYRDVENTAK